MRFNLKAMKSLFRCWRGDVCMLASTDTLLNLHYSKTCLQRLFCVISLRPWDVRWTLLHIQIRISSKHMLETFVAIQVCSALHWWYVWKSIWDSIYNVLYSCLGLNKYEACLPTFVQFPSVTVYENPLYCSLFITCVGTDRRNHLKLYCAQMHTRNGVKTGEKNTGVTRHAQCCGRIFEAGNWNNRKSWDCKNGKAIHENVSLRAGSEVTFSLSPRA